MDSAIGVSSVTETGGHSWSGGGEALRDFPVFFQRVIFFPDVPEHEAVTDVFLPLGPTGGIDT
jgi:AraC family transcriptional regulator